MHSLPKLIGFTGMAYNGKSTAANFLVDLGYTKLSFSNAVKEMAIKYFKVSKEDAYINKPPHVRTILQGIGSMMREETHPDFWATKALSKCTDASILYTIDDVRYINEAKMIKQARGILIRIVCPDTPLALTGEAANHLSETEQDTIDVDYTIIAKYGDVATIQYQLFKILNIGGTEE